MSVLLVTDGRLFDPASALDAEGDLLIVDERIAGIGKVRPRGDEQVLHAKGLWVLPGLIDMHVHLREPGQEHKENIATGAAAAAAGGFTVVAAEPNTSPPCDAPGCVGRIYQAGASAPVRVWPKCCITIGQAGKEVVDLGALRAEGAVAASDDGFAVADEAVMRKAFRLAEAYGIPLTVHVDGPEMVARDIGLSAEAGWPVHFSHVSLEEEVALVAEAQQRGLHVSGEATPHHLALCAGDAPEGDANYKMNPPLRPRRDRDALREAVAAGVIAVIASDHAPHAPEEKALPYDQAPSGVIGLETTLGVIWTALVHTGLLAARTAVRAMSAAPAQVLSQEPPALRAGARGDVTLFDPRRVWTVDPSTFRSKGRNCPFAGRRLRGKAMGTIVGGRVVMWESGMARHGAVA